MTPEELKQAVANGQADVLPPLGQANPDTPAPASLNLDEYIIVLNALRLLRQPLDAAPTFTPKNFLEMIQLVDDGVTQSIFFYINGTWAQLISSSTPPAPSNATYITQTPSSGLSAEQALNSLVSGILKVNGATGVLSSVAAPLGAIVGTTDAQTLTNKSIDAGQLTGTIATARLGSGTANGSTFLAGDQTYKQISYITWTTITGTSQTVASNTGYIANNAGVITFTLHTNPVVGDVIEFMNINGGWKVAQQAGMQIVFGNQGTTVGASGYIQSTDFYDSVRLICIKSNSATDITWAVLSGVGNITIV